LAGIALGHRRFVGQRLDLAVQLLGRFENGHEAGELQSIGGSLALGERDRQRLQIVVAQHERADFFRHRGQKRVALRPGQTAVMHGGCQGNLDVDLDVGGVDASGIVDGVRVAASALQAVGNAAALGDAEVCPLADDLGAYFIGADADRVVGAVADIRVRFGRCLHIGADASEPEQVNRAPQDRGDDLEGGGNRLVDPDRRRGFRCQRD
jgi:hypothetical protein